MVIVIVYNDAEKQEREKNNTKKNNICTDESENKQTDGTVGMKFNLYTSDIQSEISELCSFCTSIANII